MRATSLFTSPYLDEEIMYDLQIKVRNSATYELCNEVKGGGGVGCGMQCIAFPKVQCKLNREYTWGSSLKVSGEGESKKNWKNWNLTCL